MCVIRYRARANANGTRIIVSIELPSAYFGRVVTLFVTDRGQLRGHNVPIDPQSSSFESGWNDTGDNTAEQRRGGQLHQRDGTENGRVRGACR